MNEKNNWQKCGMSIWPYIVLALFTVFLLFFQLKYKTTSTVIDSYFHFSRFYDAEQQLVQHNFSFFQTNYAFDQSGRIINGLYGPGLAYLMGLLLFIVHSWFRFQLVTAALMYFAAGIGMYRLTQKATHLQWLSTLTAAAYMAFSQIQHWTSSGNFKSVTATLAPFAGLVAWQMLANPKRPIGWLKLGLFMAICAQCHLLDCLIFGSLFLICAIIGFVKTQYKAGMLRNLGASILLFIFLTANVWLPLAHFVGGEKISQPMPGSLFWTAWRIKPELSMLAAVGRSFGKGTVFKTAWQVTQPGFLYYFQVTITLVFVVIAFLNVIFVLTNFKKSFLNSVVMLIGLFYLWVTSHLFPWGHIEKSWPQLRISFQNPRRLLPIAVVFTLLSVAMSAANILAKQDLNQFAKGLTVFALLALLVSGTWRNMSSSQFYAKNELPFQQRQNSARSRDLGLLIDEMPSFPAPDYLPNPGRLTPMEVRKQYIATVMKPNKHFAKKVLPSGGLAISWQAKKTGRIKLQVVMYQESRLTVPVLQKSKIGVPTVRQQKGKNRVTLNFVTPKSGLMAIYETIIAWLMMLIYGLYYAWTGKSSVEK